MSSWFPWSLVVILVSCSSCDPEVQHVPNHASLRWSACSLLGMNAYPAPEQSLEDYGTHPRHMTYH